MALSINAQVNEFDEFHRMMPVTYLNACDSLSGDDQCCVGHEVCNEIQSNNVTIGKGSCRGKRACRRVARSGGVAVIGNNNCNGDFACENAGDNVGDYIIGNGSCNNNYACKGGGNYVPQVTGRIGDGSCNGQNSCEVGVYLPLGFTFVIGENSCNFKGSCLNHREDERPSSYVIGNNSCNAPYACSCLKTGDIVPHNSCNSVGDDQCCKDIKTRGSMNLSDPLNAPTAAPTDDPGSVGDPIIMGLNKQLFKFEGRDTAWYANVANEHLFWNMQFRQFDTCPLDENMFITAMSLSTSDRGDESDILIVATPEPIEECRVDPNAVCLGEGTLHISFDGGNTFVSQPGDYHYGSRGRVVAHNTYAACSRKWQDYDVSEQEGRNLREGGRRMTVVEKKPLALLMDKKMKMIDAEECGTWIDDRVNNNDLFQQKGHWSTLHIDIGVASFHVEYRRSDWFNRRCDFQSLDAWMTKVDSKMEKVEWNGILGETKKKIYDASTGEQVLSDRMKLLRGKDDADYEVDGPFGKIFAAVAGLGAMATSTS